MSENIPYLHRSAYSPQNNIPIKLDQKSEIYKKIKSGNYKIAIYGLGHVGSPLASVWIRSGASVIGTDKSQKVLENARIGITYIPEPGVNEAFYLGLNEKRFFIYEDPVKTSSDSFLKMICVPVLAPDGSADLSAVINVAISIGKGLKKNDVVSLNPSVPPGTTEEVIVPVLEKESGLKVEEDFYVIYNPERIFVGRAIADIEERYPGIVSGFGRKSLDVGTQLLSIIYKKGIIQMTKIKTAEAEKLFEGVYRDVNIALANELAKYSEKLGIDFWEIRNAANSQPFCHIHQPGIGVGGACIPVYPQFIINSADKLGFDCVITKLARKINNGMPKYCVEDALKMISSIKPSNELKITLLGLSFRGGVSDTRLSPTYDVINELKKMNYTNIIVHDPLVKSDNYLENKLKIKLTSDFKIATENSDLLILITDHKEYLDLMGNNKKNTPLYDGRGLLKFNSYEFPIRILGKSYF
ncbi:MAG: nucleotide sugar dehydrogenase [Nitrososphaeraceae archaeon]|nr:nucleotide sugar dehydrogenase [Nitrososphaeraceae archaeon]